MFVKIYFVLIKIINKNIDKDDRQISEGYKISICFEFKFGPARIEPRWQ